MAIDVAAISYGRRIRIGKIRSLSSLLVRFAVPVIVADFALLPMFHIGWMPWKPGYIILIIAVLIYLRTLPRERFAAVRPFFILATILMAGTAIGSAVFEYQTSV
ncbi:MAG: hypothetical protein IIC30_06360, partial [Chloroflexi bacterium]|nr:hypothetical protein [Chloroflexota bacterium]